MDDYHLSHDPLGLIGGDRNATVAAHSMYVPPSLFNFPMPPPQHYNQVGPQLVGVSIVYTWFC